MNLLGEIDPAMDAARPHGLPPEHPSEADLRRQNELVVANLRLVGEVAKQFARFKLDRDDLFMAGFQGLVIASRKYEEGRGKFSTYAFPWIRQQMQHEVARSFRIKVPKSASGFAKKLIDGKPLTPGQRAIAEKALEARRPWAEFDDRGIGLVAREHPPGHVSDEDPRIVPMMKTMESLPSSEADVLRIKFFSGDKVDRETIGRQLGITREGVRRRELKAIETLRKALREVSL